MYATEFWKAYEKSAASGYVEPSIDTSAAAARINEASVSRFYSLLGLSLEQLEQSALRCAAESLRVLETAEMAFGARALPTVGAVSIGGALNCSCEPLDLPGLRESGNYHVWLTLPSMEIIDMTLLPSLYRKGLRRSLADSFPILGYPESCQGIQWHPRLVGGTPAEFLAKLF